MPLLDKKLQHEVKKLSEKKLTKFLQGVDLYQRYLADYRGQERLEGKVMWERGSAQLLSYHDEWQDAPTIFLIPSLINRAYIFDISKDKSFLRFLKGQGMNVFMMDWGEPTDAEVDFSCTDYVERYLLDAFTVVQNEAGDTPIIPLGYCLGGMFAMALAQLRAEYIAGLALLATPWNFDTDELWHLPNVELLQELLAGYRVLPSSVLQYMFLLMNLETIEEKFSKLYACRDVAGFMAIEEWLNDGVSITVPVAKELFIDWVHNNRAYDAEWQVCGESITPEAVSIPSFVVIPERDKIVPPTCSRVLGEGIPDATVLESDAGHVGMLIGHKAPEEVWAPFLNWVESKVKQ